MRAAFRRIEILHNYSLRLKSAMEVRTMATCNAEIVKWLQWNGIGAACDQGWTDYIFYRPDDQWVAPILDRYNWFI
ncbi:uncharacterized protein V6R79_005867 [Siganus canaliculatus]